MSLVRIQCDALLNLYDTRQQDGGFATALSSLAGEELGIALLEHYFRANGKQATRVEGVPTTGQKSGYRLDGWMLLEERLLQIEVKNWGANAIGGKPYTGNYLAGWQQFLAWFRDPGLQKVLYPMKPPKGYDGLPVQPVACMWPIMHFQDLQHPMFTVPTESLPRPAFDTPFTELHVFSMSAYLRQMGSATLDLEMPKTASRIEKLRGILSNVSDGAGVTTELTPEAVAERVRPYLGGRHIGDIWLEVDASRIHLRNGYWRIPIRPSRWPKKTFAYYEELADLEEEVEEKEGIPVTMASGDPLIEDEE